MTDEPTRPPARRGEDEDASSSTQALLLDLSTAVARATVDNADDLLVDMLRRVAERFDMAGVGVWRRDGPTLVREFGARQDGTTVRDELIVEMSDEWIDVVERRGFGFVTIGDLSATGVFVDDDRAAALVAPLMAPVGLVGVIGMADPSRRTWSDDEIDTVRAVAHLVQQLRTRIDAERAAQRRLKLEGLQGRAAARAVVAGDDDVEGFLSELLAEVVEFFDVSEASVWAADGTTHECVARSQREPVEQPDRIELVEAISEVDGSGPLIVSVDDLRAGGFGISGPPGASVVAFPFVDDSGPIGSFALIDPVSREWSDDELATLDSIARAVGQLRTRLATQRSLARRRRFDALLTQMSTDLVHLELDRVDDEVTRWLERIRAEVGVTSVAVWTLDAAVPQLDCRWEATADGRPLAATVSPLPWRHRAVAAVQGVEDGIVSERWTLGELLGDAAAGLDGEVLLFPVVLDEVDVLALSVFDGSGRRHTDSTVNAFRSIAAFLGQLRRRLVLEERSQRQRAADRLLREIAVDLVDRAHDDRQAAIESVLRRTADHLGSPVGTYWTIDPAGGVVTRAAVWAADPADQEELEGVAFDIDHPLVGLVRTARSALVLAGGRGPDGTELPVTSDVAAAPLRLGGEARGAILFDLGTPARSNSSLDSDLDVLDGVAALLQQLEARVEAEQEVARRLEMEDLLRRFATRLVEAGTEDGDAVGGALVELVGEIGVDHASVWRLHRDGATLDVSSQFWVAPDRKVSVPAEMRHFVIDAEPLFSPAWDGVFDGAVDWAFDEVPNTVKALFAPVPPSGARRIAVLGQGDVEDPVQWFGVSRPGGTPFDRHEIQMLRSAANILGQHEARIAAERWFVAAFESAPVAISMRDEGYRLISCNAAYEALTGRTEAELTGTDMSGLVALSSEETEKYRREAMESGVEHEAAYIRPDGSMRWAEVRTIPVVIPGRRDPLVLSYVDDVTEQRRSREMLEYQASHDELTGLPNRRAFVGEVSVEIEGGGDCAILLLDLDRFKVVNDSLGHSGGDELLIAAADRIRTSLRPDDLVARLGGDEFAVLLRAPVDEVVAGAVANRLSELLRSPVRVGGHEVYSSASVGIAMPEPGDSVEDVLRHADAAMYQAKGRGRDRWESFDSSMRDAIAERIGMESDLRRAIEHGQLELYHQPEVLLDRRAIVGVEALLRWNHPARGLLTAGSFVGLAEETGLIVDIGRWVLEQATLQCAEWRAEGHDVVMRVNLSARQLREEVVGEVQDALRQAALDPTALCLEITETAIMDDVAESERILHRFRELGVQVAVDDFGTGFSSLAYLKRFPVDILKIDRTFVDGLGVDADDTAIVRSVIGLARTLRLEVVAEGIENERQVDELVALGCRRGQGFHLARPAPAAIIGEILAAQRPT